MTTSGNKAEFFDYLDLALLRLAKIGRPRLSAEADQAGFYEEFFTDLDYAIRASDSDPRYRLRAQVMREVFAQDVPPGAHVLDVGCGLGDNLQTIFRRDLRLYGVEYSSASARQATRLLGDRAEIHNASATSIPFKDENFQVAICIEVLEHIAEERQVMREINRVLPVGGKLLMSVPYRHWFPAYVPLMGHLRHYTRSDFSRLLDEHGFAVMSHLPNYPQWVRYANYCYILCRSVAGTGRLVGRRSGPTQVRLPFMKRPLLEWLLGLLEPLRLRESVMDYAALETSTFVLAVKSRNL